MTSVRLTVAEHNSRAETNGEEPRVDRGPGRLHDLLMDLARLTSLLHPDLEVPGRPLPLSQAFALHELDTSPPLSQRDLARRLRLEKSTVSRLVAEMEQAGLLARHRDPGNRRYYQLRLTDRGRAAHAQMAAGLHDRYERLAAGMTAAEHEALLTGLPALIRVLRDEVNREQDQERRREEDAANKRSLFRTSGGSSGSHDLQPDQLETLGDVGPGDYISRRVAEPGISPWAELTPP